jgi:hypothetical protein
MDHPVPGTVMAPWSELVTLLLGGLLAVLGGIVRVPRGARSKCPLIAHTRRGSLLQVPRSLIVPDRRAPMCLRGVCVRVICQVVRAMRRPPGPLCRSHRGSNTSTCSAGATAQRGDQLVKLPVALHQFIDAALRLLAANPRLMCSRMNRHGGTLPREPPHYTQTASTRWHGRRHFPDASYAMSG